MSRGHKGVPDALIYGSALALIAALVVLVTALMQEPNPPASQNSRSDTHEIVRLPEELSADFKYDQGWWTANGPAGDGAIRRLAREHRTLEAICLNQAGISANGLDALKGHGLRSLDMINSEMNAEMASSISKIDGLRELQLKDQLVSDAVFTSLTGPASLQSLLLKFSTVSKIGFENFHFRFPAIKTLTLINCKNINDSIVAELMACSKLESLNLISTPLSAKSTVALTKKLPVVCLSYEYQPDASELVEHLESANLQELHLNGDSLSQRAIAKLSTMTRLQRLTLSDCRGLKDVEISQLKKGLPNCKIHLGGNRTAPEMGLLE